MNWKVKQQNSGVRTWLLILKGFLMGAADVIPGVSGGTIALIVGVYEELVQTISDYDLKMLTLLKERQMKALWQRMNLSFLLPLLFGIVTAILSLASLMSYLLQNYQSGTFAVFFGLILGSCLLMLKEMQFNLKNALFLLLGVILPFWLIGFLPNETARTLPAFFISAFIAICAMILPGISGSYILLILGKYRQVLEAIKQPFSGDHWLVILVFVLGAGLGIISFSKLLKWLLKNYHAAVFAFLIGMMLGSLQKIWPFYGLESIISKTGFIYMALTVLGLALVFLIQKLNPDSKNNQTISQKGMREK